MHLIIHI